MWPSMNSEVIFHFMKNLFIFNVSIHKIGSEIYVLERKKLKYRSLGITGFFVRYRITYVLKGILI